MQFQNTISSEKRHMTLARRVTGRATPLLELKETAGRCGALGTNSRRFSAFLSGGR